MIFTAKKAVREAASVIGSGACIEADVCFSGVLRVEGTVRGKVSTLPGQSGTLIVGAEGRVEGEVAVPHLVVHGTVNAAMTRCDKLELGATARVTGHLHYGSIDVTPGAVVDAQLVHGGDEEAIDVKPSLALARA